MTTSDERVVLVTGAANGIGAALAGELVGRRRRVVLVDRDADGLERVVRDLGAARAVAAVADVTDLGAMEGAVTAGLAAFGRIDEVVANAGIASYGSVLAVDPEAFRRVIDVNVTGAFHTVRAALPHVIERRGYVLLVSSLAAFAAAPGMAAYNASKAGVEHFGNALRVEVAQHGVDVGVAHMSWIDTPLVRDARADLTSFHDMIAGLPGPMKRTLPVDEGARAIADGIDARRRRIMVPRWVGGVRRARNFLATAAGDRVTRQEAGRLLARMDDEVRRLGRSTSARNT